MPRWIRLLLSVALLLPTLTHTANAQDAPPTVSFPGNYGQAIGAPSWAPDDPAVAATDAAGDGRYTLTVTLPRGSYEFKVALNGAWDENYGRGGVANGENIPFDVAAEAPVTFVFDLATRAISVAMGETLLVQNGEPLDAPPPAPPIAQGDGLFAIDAILHDSRSDAFRTPFGAAPTGSDVTLRLRTAASDVQRVRLLVDTLATESAFSQEMDPVATVDGYTWWQTTLAVGSEPVVHNYKFELRDGDATLFYADDAPRIYGGAQAFDGGTGATSTTRPLAWAGWDIYTYLADFEAPAWAQNAIIYQIFPDRFRNGDVGNDPQATDFGYPEERGQSFPIAPWNTIVPDPDPNDPANPWYATWNSTFYGGDLQGVADKLDYLQALGVNTIYFTPIQEAVTNHRYDARDYRQVEDSLAVRDDPAASMAYFDAFAQEVADRGMHLILDAVPNHSSSDSPMFDRYDRWPEVGACEAVDSPWRDFYMIEPAQPAGSGVCAGDANYRGFAGISTLPQANTADEAVIDNWLGENGIANFWLDKPGVDGWRVDTVPDVVAVNPTFFEPFRSVVKAAHPDALLITESWPEDAVRERVLGDEFDTTMNYRFAFSVLGFLRDTTFSETTDPYVQPFSASEFDRALRAIQEDYPPAALSTAMNLLSSHDINRAVRVLDHDPIDYATGTPANNFADGRTRLALAAVLQFTLPGAPTIFYGDEVGLVGFGSDPLRDDPHNRQPYPWEDEAGYDTLPAWRQADGDLLALYQQLGALRNAHSFLRSGAWQTLLTDDAGIYAYLRSDEKGAAVVAVNRSQSDAPLTLNLSGSVPYGATLDDPFGGESVTLADTGALTLTVPAMGFRVLVTTPAVEIARPPAPALAAVAGGNAVTLTVSSAVTNAPLVAIYRAPVDGGYAEIARVALAPDVVFVDDGAQNGQRWFYTAALVGDDGMIGSRSESVSATPYMPIAAATLGGPVALDHTISAITPTAVISGVVLAPGLTEGVGAAPGLRAELGLLPEGVADFTWTTGAFAGDLLEGDVYTATLLPETAGAAIYKWRFSTNDGQDWLLSDSGQLNTLPSADTQAPKAPFRLDPIGSAPSHVSFAWRVSRPPDLAFYRICRADLTAGEAGCALQTQAPKTTNIYTDTTVTTGHTYSYTVTVVDTAFNQSPPSKAITRTAELSVVDVTFRMLAPAETPADAQLYLAGDNPDVFGAAYDPARLPMTNLGGGQWEVTVQAKDGVPLLYKYTRGSWESVEQWGSIAGFANRQVTVAKNPENTMLIEDTATDWGSGGPDDRRGVLTWRDPLVKVATPAPDSAGPVDVVRVQFSVFVSAKDVQSVIVVQDAAGAQVAGTVAAEGADAFVWTPTAPLVGGMYTATAFHVEATTPMLAPYVWSFDVQ